jgi:hypothetical protein
MTKTQYISKLIIEAAERNGGDFRKALDEVCGAGTFARLASDVYDELRARSAA